MKKQINHEDVSRQGKSGFEFIQSIIIIALTIMLCRAQTLKSKSSSSSSWEPSAARQKRADGSFFEIDPDEIATVSHGANPVRRIGISLNNSSCGSSFPQDETFLRSHKDTRAQNELINSSWLSDLVAKLWQQESGSRLNPPAGDGGDAIGPLQLHPEVLKDVNKYYGTNFVPDDRQDLAKSKQIAQMYIAMWLGKSAFSVQRSGINIEEEAAVRIFNGGPRGWRSEATDEYWNKYKKIEHRTLNIE